MSFQCERLNQKVFILKHLKNKYHFKMKKLVPTICLVLLTGTMLFVNANALDNVTTPNLLNVEALANPECDNSQCYEVGSLDCPVSKDKVKYILW